MKKTINCKGTLIDLSEPKIMGIINSTPDSFFSGSRAESENLVLKLAEKHIEDGAHFLDIGGYSTRPGAEEIDENLEISRVVGPIKALAKRFPNIPISIDTFRAEVARIAVNEGASLINDVSGGKLDKEMLPTAAKLQVPYVLMHMRGNPSTMTSLTNYNSLIPDLIKELLEGVEKLKNLGLVDIIVDPGFGFSKTIEQNYEILKNLRLLQILDCPILVGLSRKSMVYKTLNLSPEESLVATSALNLMALNNGASILRVHDCKEAKQMLILHERLK